MRTREMVLAWLTGMVAWPNALREAQMARQFNNGTARLSLLVLVFTTKENHARRSWQRDTWIGARWRRLDKPGAQVNWRYVYVHARDGASDPVHVDRVVGDAVTLGAVREGYANLVYKTLEALRWAVRRVRFEALLKTDDDTVVHIGRAAAWLTSRGRLGPPPTLYAGRVFYNSQVRVRVRLG